MYIGSSEYEILSFDENRVMLYDNASPLFNQEMTRSDFDRLVSENPMNEHLLVKEKSESVPEKSLAQRLVALYKDYDFYDYQNNLELGETDEDAVSKMAEHIKDKQSCEDIISYMTDYIAELSINENEAQQTFDTPDYSHIEYLQTLLDDLIAYSATIEEKTETVPENTEESERQPYEELNKVQEIPEQTSLKPPVSSNSKAPIIHADIPISERHNFNLNDNEVEYVGKKERFRRNIMAIQLLKKCQEENRFATPEEQVILSKYVGWGGIPEAFDERNSAWATEYLELSTILTPEEYAAARESTLTAFYTPPEVITAIYSAIENMGFTQGNILEIIIPSLIQGMGKIKKCALAV